MKKIAIIGANEFQRKLVLKAKEMGIETHVFAWEEGAVSKDVADYFYPISITEKNSILDIVKVIGIDGICSIASDMAMPTVNYIAEKLKLICNSNQCTIITTNKFKMREILRKYNLPIPEYQLIKKVTDVDCEKMEFPIIVKPIDRSGSRGIYKVFNLTELEFALKKSKEVSFSDEILIEEYISGKEYSIEAISQNGVHKVLQITEKITSGTPNFIEIAHISPAQISEKLKDKILKVINKSLDVLEVKNGASHSEIKISTDGDIKIIEIAARMGGDFIGSDMVEISTGFDFMKNVIKISMGEDIEFNNKVYDKIALVKFFFDEIDVEQFKILKIKYPNLIKEFYIKSQMEKVIDSSTRNGYSIFEIENRNQLKEVMEILEISFG